MLDKAGKEIVINDESKYSNVEAHIEGVLGVGKINWEKLKGAHTDIKVGFEHIYTYGLFSMRCYENPGRWGDLTINQFEGEKGSGWLWQETFRFDSQNRANAVIRRVAEDFSQNLRGYLTFTESGNIMAIGCKPPEPLVQATPEERAEMCRTAVKNVLTERGLLNEPTETSPTAGKSNSSLGITLLTAGN